jgi:hypothetical protein
MQLPRARRQEGSILIVALGVLTLLSILGVAFASLMRLERRATENYVDGKRMDLLLDSALDRVIADLFGAKNFRSYSVYQDTPWLYVLHSAGAGGGEQDLAQGRVDIEDPRVGQWEVFSRSEGQRGRYKTKVIDCAAQINLNGEQDSLARMLDNLGRAIEGSTRLQQEGRQALNPFYTGPRKSGNQVTGKDIVRYRRLIPGGKFASKTQLKPLIGPENYEILKDFVTCYSWVDPYTFRPTDGEDEVSEFEGAGGPAGGGRAVGGGQTTRQEPASGTPRVDDEPRSPVNVNTAPEEVLISCIQGLAGRRIFPFSRLASGGGFQQVDQSAQIQGGRVIGQEEIQDVTPRAIFVYTQPLQYEHAKKIAEAIIRHRKEQPFKTWRAYNENGEIGFEDFIDGLDESFFPPPNTVEVIDPDQVNQRRVQTDILSGGAENPMRRLWDKGHEGTERSLRRQKGLASHAQNAWYYDLVKGVLKANFNPNTRLSRYNANATAHVPVDKSDLVWAQNDRVTLRKGHTTEFCFDSMGIYEITTLGSIEDLRSARAEEKAEAAGTPGAFVRPFQRQVQTIVKVFDVLRHTTQFHFEKNFRSSAAVTSKDDRQYVVTWPEPMEALTEVYSLGGRRDGRIELAGLLDGRRALLNRGQRQQDFKRQPTVIMAHGFQDRDQSSVTNLRRVLRGNSKNPVADELTLALNEVLNANYSRRSLRDGERVTVQEVQQQGIVFESAALPDEPDAQKEVIGCDLRPDGLHTSLLLTPHLGAKILILPARQRIGETQTAGGSPQVGATGIGSRTQNVMGNVPYHKGGIAFWVKFDFDGDDPVFSGLIGCTQVIEDVPLTADDYQGSEGVQFYIFKNMLGELRIVRMYYHQAYPAGGGGGEGGGGATGGGQLLPFVEEGADPNENPIREYLDPEKIISRSDILVNVRHFKAHEWHHIAVDWDDGSVGSPLRLYVDFQPVPGAVPQTPQALVEEEPNSWVRLNVNRPWDGLQIGGFIRDQHSSDAGVFKWFTNSASSGGASSGVTTVADDIKRVLANATIDELITYEGDFPGTKQYYGGTGSPGYFTNQTGVYANMFEIPLPPDVDSVVLRSLDWTSYYPVMYTDSQPNSRPQALRSTPIECQAFFRSDGQPPSSFQEPWRLKTTNRLAGRRVYRVEGGLKGRNAEVVYRFSIRGARAQSGTAAGGVVHTPAIDDVTLTYFLPTPRILFQEEVD